jgi:cholesterol transport system auxiliary component
MKKHVATWLSLILVLALPACGLPHRAGEAPALYDLGIDDRAAPPRAARPPIMLVFENVPALSGPGMIWRVGESASPKTYTEARWSAPPAELARQRLMERLSRQGAILTGGTTGLPRLQITLTRFEQVFAEDGSRSEGLLALQAVLLEQSRVVAQKRVQRAVPAPSQDAEGGARALRQAVDEAADELAGWLADVLH